MRSTTLDAAKQRLRPRFPAAPCRRQRRRCRALQQQRRSAVPNTLCLEDDGFPRRDAGDAGVPQPIRHARPEQQSDPLPARQRQHLRDVPYGTIDRTTTDATTVGASLQATERREAVRPRQPLHRRRQHRPQPGRFRRRPASSAIIYPDLSVGAESGDSGQRLDHPHARQYRLQPGQSRTRATPITGSTRPTRSTSRRACR